MRSKAWMGAPSVGGERGSSYRTESALGTEDHRGGVEQVVDPFTQKTGATTVANVAITLGIAQGRETLEDADRAPNPGPGQGNATSAATRVPRPAADHAAEAETARSL